MTGTSQIHVTYKRDQDRVTLGQGSLWQNSPMMIVPISAHQPARISVVIDRPTLTVLVNGSRFDPLISERRS